MKLCVRRGLVPPHIGYRVGSDVMMRVLGQTATRMFGQTASVVANFRSAHLISLLASGESMLVLCRPGPGCSTLGKCSGGILCLKSSSALAIANETASFAGIEGHIQWATVSVNKVKFGAEGLGFQRRGRSPYPDLDHWPNP
jgi:hypothetical protein